VLLREFRRQLLAIIHNSPGFYHAEKNAATGKYSTGEDRTRSGLRKCLQ
jgi:hypothetical protein